MFDEGLNDDRQRCCQRSDMGSDDYFLMSRMEIFSTLYTYKEQKANKIGEKENSSLQEGSFYGSLWTARSRALVPIPQWRPNRAQVLAERICLIF